MRQPSAVETSSDLCYGSCELARPGEAGRGGISTELLNLHAIDPSQDLDEGRPAARVNNFTCETLRAKLYVRHPSAVETSGGL